MVTIEEAQKIILRHVSRLETEEVSVLQALGRVSAEDVFAPWDIPAADNSAMDGYAIASPAPKGKVLRTNGYLAAGEVPKGAVGSGEAVRIMTGAPIPPGCDTVVPIEDVEETPGGIRLKGAVNAGANTRERGEDARA